MLRLSIILLICGSLTAYSFANSQCHRHKMCSECVRDTSGCTFCTSPRFTGNHRCDTEDALKEFGCHPAEITSVSSKIEFNENRTIGTVDPRTITVIQLSPQRVVIHAKPGEEVTWELEYKHTTKDGDVLLRHSLGSDAPLKITFSVDCGDGHWQETNRCSNVESDQKIVFKVKTVIDEALCNKGTSVASLGISGVRSPVGLYVYPLCGCDCEKLDNQEINSRYCALRGNLVCGQCKCSGGYSGSRCECRLPEGVTPENEIEQCKASPNEEVCSGNGVCICGRCRCRDPTTRGRYCEVGCDPCPNDCSGNGKCYCGQCVCNRGFEEKDCSCSRDTSQCRSADGLLCSGHGECFCNKCTCSSPYTGETCEVSPTAPATTVTHHDFMEDNSADFEGDDQEDEDEQEEEYENTDEPEIVTLGHSDENKEDGNSVAEPEQEPEPPHSDHDEQTEDDMGHDGHMKDDMGHDGHMKDDMGQDGHQDDGMGHDGHKEDDEHGAPETEPHSEPEQEASGDDDISESEVNSTIQLCQYLSRRLFAISVLTSLVLAFSSYT